MCQIVLYKPKSAAKNFSRRDPETDKCVTEETFTQPPRKSLRVEPCTLKCNSPGFTVKVFSCCFILVYCNFKYSLLVSNPETEGSPESSMSQRQNRRGPNPGSVHSRLGLPRADSRGTGPYPGGGRRTGNAWRRQTGTERRDRREEDLLLEERERLEEERRSLEYDQRSFQEALIQDSIFTVQNQVYGQDTGQDVAETLPPAMLQVESVAPSDVDYRRDNGMLQVTVESGHHDVDYRRVQVTSPNPSYEPESSRGYDHPHGNRLHGDPLVEPYRMYPEDYPGMSTHERSLERDSVDPYGSREANRVSPERSNVEAFDIRVERGRRSRSRTRDTFSPQRQKTNRRSRDVEQGQDGNRRSGDVDSNRRSGDVDSNRRSRDVDSNRRSRDVDSNRRSRDVDSNRRSRDVERGQDGNRHSREGGRGQDGNRRSRDLDSNRRSRDVDSDRRSRDVDSNRRSRDVELGQDSNRRSRDMERGSNWEEQLRERAREFGRQQQEEGRQQRATSRGRLDPWGEPSRGGHGSRGESRERGQRSRSYDQVDAVVYGADDYRRGESGYAEREGLYRPDEAAPQSPAYSGTAFPAEPPQDGRDDPYRREEPSPTHGGYDDTLSGLPWQPGPQYPVDEFGRPVSPTPHDDYPAGPSIHGDRHPHGDHRPLSSSRTPSPVVLRSHQENRFRTGSRLEDGLYSPVSSNQSPYLDSRAQYGRAHDSRTLDSRAQDSRAQDSIDQYSRDLDSRGQDSRDYYSRDLDSRALDNRVQDSRAVDKQADRRPHTDMPAEPYRGDYVHMEERGGGYPYHPPDRWEGGGGGSLECQLTGEPAARSWDRTQDGREERGARSAGRKEGQAGGELATMERDQNSRSRYGRDGRRSDSRDGWKRESQARREQPASTRGRDRDGRDIERENELQRSLADTINKIRQDPDQTSSRRGNDRRPSSRDNSQGGRRGNDRRPSSRENSQGGRRGNQRSHRSSPDKSSRGSQGGSSRQRSSGSDSKGVKRKRSLSPRGGSRGLREDSRGNRGSKDVSRSNVDDSKGRQSTRDVSHSKEGQQSTKDVSRRREEDTKTHQSSRTASYDKGENRRRQSPTRGRQEDTREQREHRPHPSDQTTQKRQQKEALVQEEGGQQWPLQPPSAVAQQLAQQQGQISANWAPDRPEMQQGGLERHQGGLETQWGGQAPWQDDTPQGQYLDFGSSLGHRNAQQSAQGLQSDLHGAGMGLQSDLHGAGMGLQRDIHGAGIGLPTELHGVGMGLPTELHGAGMGLPTELHGHGHRGRTIVEIQPAAVPERSDNAHTSSSGPIPSSNLRELTKAGDKESVSIPTSSLSLSGPVSQKGATQANLVELPSFQQAEELKRQKPLMFQLPATSQPFPPTMSFPEKLMMLVDDYGPRTKQEAEKRIHNYEREVKQGYLNPRAEDDKVVEQLSGPLPPGGLWKLKLLRRIIMECLPKKTDEARTRVLWLCQKLLPSEGIEVTEGIFKAMMARRVQKNAPKTPKPVIITTPEIFQQIQGQTESVSVKNEGKRDMVVEYLGRLGVPATREAVDGMLRNEGMLENIEKMMDRRLVERYLRQINVPVTNDAVNKIMNNPDVLVDIKKTLGPREQEDGSVSHGNHGDYDGNQGNSSASSSQRGSVGSSSVGKDRAALNINKSDTDSYRHLLSTSSHQAKPQAVVPLAMVGGTAAPVMYTQPAPHSSHGQAILNTASQHARASPYQTQALTRQEDRQQQRQSDSFHGDYSKHTTEGQQLSTGGLYAGYDSNRHQQQSTAVHPHTRYDQPHLRTDTRQQLYTQRSQQLPTQTATGDSLDSTRVFIVELFRQVNLSWVPERTVQEVLGNAALVRQIQQFRAAGMPLEVLVNYLKQCLQSLGRRP